MNPRFTFNALANEKVFRVFSYTLVFLMMVCAILTFGNLIQILAPHWHVGIIATFMLFIVIDRLYTYRQLKSLTPLSSEWAIAIGGQWVLIVLLLRFLLSYANGLDSFQTDLSRLARGYIAELFTPEFVASFVLALLIWFLCGRFLYILDEIGLDQVLALNPESAPRFVQSDVIPAHQRLVSLIFSIGIGLVILTALARIDYRTFASNVQGIPPLEFNRFSGAEAGALFYFVFGLALLSLSRLMSLQTHWNQLRIPVSSKNLYRQWGMYSLFFLLILALIVSLLPAGDSLGFFSLLGTLFNFLLSILFFLGQLIISLFMLALSLPFLLFGKGPPILQPSAPPPLPVLPPVPPPGPTTDSAIWALIRSILLWGSLLVIIVFAFIQFGRQHGGLRAAFRSSRIGNWLMLAWQWVYRSADKTRGSFARVIADGWQSIISRLEGKHILARASWINLRSLDPRRQIYFFYLAMIRRGGEQDVPRKPSQTPSEYAVTLGRALPSADKDIDSITRAFVEARYSRHDVNPEDAGVIKAIWARLRQALQRRSKTE
jgi:hypothetical protein